MSTRNRTPGSAEAIAAMREARRTERESLMQQIDQELASVELPMPNNPRLSGVAISREIQDHMRQRHQHLQEAWDRVIRESEQAEQSRLTERMRADALRDAQIRATAELQRIHTLFTVGRRWENENEGILEVLNQTSSQTFFATTNVDGQGQIINAQIQANPCVHIVVPVVNELPRVSEVNKIVKFKDKLYLFNGHAWECITKGDAEPEEITGRKIVVGE